MTEFVSTVEHSEVSTISLQYGFIQRKINDMLCHDNNAMFWYDDMFWYNDNGMLDMMIMIFFAMMITIIIYMHMTLL